MSPSTDTTEKSLRKWEALFRSRLNDILLLADFNLSQSDCESIGACVRTMVSARGQLPTIHRLREEFPLTFATFLVAEGVYFYSAGAYWSDVGQRTGISSQNLSSPMGQAFEKILEQFMLPTFRKLEFEAATRYVSKILAHGGIPRHSLPDFFARLLRPAISHGMTTDEVIEQWRAIPGRFFDIDKPVRRFLLYGGSTARRFLENCLQMAEQAFVTGKPPSTQDFALPPHVVEAFAQWLVQAGPAPAVRNRYAKPLLTYEPWVGKIAVDLPQQTIEGGPLVQARWSIHADDAVRSIPLPLHPEDRWLKSEPKTYFLDQPAKAYLFSLEIDRQTVRTWTFPGQSSEQPLMAFDPESGRMVVWRDALPACALWLVLPKTYTLWGCSEGRTKVAVRVLEEFPALGLGWSQYRGMAVDLTGLSTLGVAGGSESVQIPLQLPDEGLPDVELVGGRLIFASGDEKESFRVYSGAPPHLVIPLLPGRLLEDMLAKLKVVINQLPETPIARLNYDYDANQRTLTCALDQAALLGKNAVGTYTLTIKGAPAQITKFNLRVLPEIQMRGHETLYTPSSSGNATPARITLGIPQRFGIDIEESEVLRLSGPVAGAAGEANYAITAGPTVQGIPVTLVTGEHKRIDFTIIVRRIRWTLQAIEPSSTEWSHSLLTLGRDVVERAKNPELVVEVPLLPGHQLDLNCALYDDNWILLQELGGRPSGKQRRFHSFALETFLDTIRQSDAKEVFLVLQGTHRTPQGTSQSFLFRAVGVERELRVTNLEVLSREAADQRELEISWSQAYRLRHRVLRFWSLTRPWTPPLEFAIPDDEAQLSLRVASDLLPAGRYLLEFGLANAWQSGARRIPVGDNFNTFERVIGIDTELGPIARDDGDALKHLELYLFSGDGKELRLFERLFQPEYAPQLLSALFVLTNDVGMVSRAPHTDIALLAELLLSDINGLVHAVVSHGDSWERGAFQRLLLRLGIPSAPVDWHAARPPLSDRDLEQLWDIWPPLGLLVESKRIRDGEEKSNHRALRFLGEHGLDLAHQRDSAPPAVDPKFFGPRLEPWLLQVGTAQLRSFFNEFSIIPKSLLDIDAWVVANLEWVEWMKSKPERTGFVSALVETAMPAADEAIERLTLHDSCAAEILSLLCERRSAAEPDLLCNVPFLTGVTALAVRINARRTAATHHANVKHEDWSAVASDLFSFAPRLFTRDLCLMMLLLSAFEREPRTEIPSLPGDSNEG